MSRSALLVDVSFLCYRAMYTTANLRNGVMYGVLRDVDTCRHKFKPDVVGFAFDSRHSLRKKAYPRYKSNRKPKDQQTEDRRAAMHKQRAKLRKEVLPQLGFNNLWGAKGYEADDLIAAAIPPLLDKGFQVTIVSSDHDLYQLLRPGVRMYNLAKREIMTAKAFQDKYNTTPELWAKVKAIAGCSSDNIEGVYRVGEVTAIRYLNDQATPHQVKAIQEAENVCKSNFALTRLPFKGCPTPRIRKDHVSDEKWEAAVHGLDMVSLAKKKRK